MMNDSSFETLDWKTEAKRVARAFGLSEECYFQEVVPSGETNGISHYHHLCWKDKMGGYMFPDGEGLNFVCLYIKQRGRLYYYEREYGRAKTGITIAWNGDVKVLAADLALIIPLVKGLFHLGLLTPEIEAALEVSVTEQQKVDWATAYNGNTNDL